MTDATTPTAPPAPTVATMLTGDLSPAQAEKMIGWTKQDLLSGKITPEKANDILTQLGATEAQRAPDSRSDEEKQLDAQFPPASPSQYQIRYGKPGEDVPMTPELKQFDANARDWMASSGMMTEVGNSFVSTIAKITERTAKMTPDELERYGHFEYQRLERAHGPALEERLQAAGRMVEALEQKTPGLKALLQSRGIGDSAMVANMLIAQAQKYHARERAKQARGK